MKFAIVFVSCVLVLFREANGGEIKLPQEIVDLVKGLSKTCAEETSLGESELAELRKGKVNDDPKVKCYLKCMMRQLQAMREDGTLDIELIDASMPDVIREHGGMETVEKCKHIQEADMCETAYKLILCFKTENPSLSAMFE